MIPQLFDIENGVVVPTAHCHTIHWLKAIIDEFPSSYPKIYTYLFYMCYPDFKANPYMEMAEEDKEITILKDIQADFDPEEEVIQVALKNYQERVKTIKYRAWEAQKMMYERMINFLKTASISTGRDGSSTEIRSMMKDMPNIAKVYDQAYTELQEEISTRVRGQIDLAYDQ
jgi:hypothetical protein